MAQGPAWVEGTRWVARAGWRNENHSILPADYVDIITGWETVNRLHPISGLRRTLAHVAAITEEWIDRLKAMDCAVNLSSSRTSGPPAALPTGSSWTTGSR